MIDAHPLPNPPPHHRIHHASAFAQAFQMPFHHPLTLPFPPQCVKNSVCDLFASFRRKPESSVFNPVKTSRTPVFTGVTTEKQFFQTFPKAGERAWLRGDTRRTFPLDLGPLHISFSAAGKAIP
jgi:hypothetical protein